MRAESYIAINPEAKDNIWINKGNNHEYIVKEDSDGQLKILFDVGWTNITRYDLQRYYRKKSN